MANDCSFQLFYDINVIHSIWQNKMTAVFNYFMSNIIHSMRQNKMANYCSFQLFDVIYYSLNLAK